MDQSKRFILGVPNPGSSLFESTIGLLGRIGITVSVNGRSFEGEIEGMRMFDKVFFMRPQDIPLAISKGIIDCGICGWDCVVERALEKQLTKIVELNYSKKSQKPVRIVVFSKLFLEVKNAGNITITTEYPNITKKFFSDVPAENIDFSHGTTEAKVVAGMFDYGVCVTESGKSLLDNGLNIVKELLISPTVFMAKISTPEMEGFGQMLSGALYAKRFQLITMNADKKAKEQIISILPSFKSPTVNSLENGEYSISTVVEISDLANLLLKLKLLGATDILGTDINYVIK
jgi:ATP phosphoribosyltransferase